MASSFLMWLFLFFIFLFYFFFFSLLFFPLFYSSYIFKVNICHVTNIVILIIFVIVIIIIINVVTWIQPCISYLYLTLNTYEYNVFLRLQLLYIVGMLRKENVRKCNNHPYIPWFTKLDKHDNQSHTNYRETNWRNMTYLIQPYQVCNQDIETKITRQY